MVVLLWILASRLNIAFAQNQYIETSLGAEYMLTAYSFDSPHNVVASSIDIAWWRAYSNLEYGSKIDFGYNPLSICGHRIGAMGTMRTPLFHTLYADVGLGLSYYTKSLPLTGDSNNVYISTWLTFMIELGLSIQCGEHWTAGLRLLHSSNGNMHRPNRGLNFFHIDLGYRWGSPPQTTNSSTLPSIPTHPIEANSFGFTVSPSLTASRHSLQQGLFFCYDLQLNYRHRTTKQLAIGGTIDLWYNFSHVWQLPRYHDNYTFPMYVGGLGFLEVMLGHISIRAGVGYTLLSSSRVMVPVYERLALYYHKNRHYFGLGINAHEGQAEYIEWSYGLWLPLKRA